MVKNCSRSVLGIISGTIRLFLQSNHTNRSSAEPQGIVNKRAIRLLALATRSNDTVFQYADLVADST
jgi:hypothetical protein